MITTRCFWTPDNLAGLSLNSDIPTNSSFELLKPFLHREHLYFQDQKQHRLQQLPQQIDYLDFGKRCANLTMNIPDILLLIFDHHPLVFPDSATIVHCHQDVLSWIFQNHYASRWINNFTRFVKRYIIKHNIGWLILMILNFKFLFQSFVYRTTLYP